MIRFACPSCGMAVSAPEECAGRGTTCRGCNNPIIVPQPAISLVPQQPPKPLLTRDKTALGQVISHTPTGVKPPRSPETSPARNYPPSKPKKATTPVAATRQEPVKPRKRSMLAKFGMIAGGILVVFGAGGLFGFGVYRYLDSQKNNSDGRGSDSYAQAPARPEADAPQPPRDPEPPRDKPSEEKPTPAGESLPPPQGNETPPSTRKEEPPPKKEESPPPVPPKKETPPKPDPSPKLDPVPPKKEEPTSPKKDEPAPPKKDEPTSSRKEEPKPSKKEEPKLDERLKPLVNALKSKKTQERLQAVEDLGKLKEAARPVARGLCETLVGDKSPAVRQAALEALEKIHPELHAIVVVFAVEADSNKHAKAARDIAALGEQGRAAVPVLLAHVRSATTRFSDQGVALLGEDAQALAQIAPDDAVVQKTLLDLTRFTYTPPRYRTDIGRPARAAAVRVLGELLDKHPEQAKHLAPGLIVATRGMTDVQVRGQAVAVLGKMAENHADLRPQIAGAFVALANAGDLTVIAQFGKCDRDARDAIPLLKKLKLHPVEAVRTAANEAITQIEESLASATTPPRKDEPKPKTEPKPRAEDPNLPRELRPIVAQLQKGMTEERIKAAADLAEMGEKAMPAARALCDAALAPSQKVSRAALQALEKVNPELQQPVFTLLVDEKAANHLDALKKLNLLGEQGKPATTIVLHEIKRCQELLNDPRARWGQPTLIQVTTESVKTLPKIASDDPKALKTIIDLTKFTFPTNQGGVFPPGFVSFANAPFRKNGLDLLGELAEGQPDFRKQIIPPVVAILKEAVQRTNAPNEFEALTAIAEVDQAGNALLKCGAEAKQTLTKEVMPRLKDLRFHKSANVRKTAENLRQKIEDAP